jgi:hypothetical protein
MIGVAARDDQLGFVSEFFELFKTPWERLVPGKRYDVVLSADGCTEPLNAALGLVYSTREHPIDRRLGAHVGPFEGPVTANWAETTLPIYGEVATFRGNIGPGCLAVSQQAVGYQADCNGTTVRRLGYDLFGEIELLLARGQPKSHAPLPTLEHHIALMRHFLDDAGAAYVEVPPRPDGADFVCCLTHDVDFFGITRHTADRTLAGFALRGTVGTLRDVVSGRRPMDEAVRNWGAVLSLPLVFLGLRPDPWQPFRDYAKADRGHSATFFLVPFSHHAGVAPDGTIATHRAVAYGLTELEGLLRNGARAGTEFAVHGLDAWRDPDRGRLEIDQLRAMTDQEKAGVRIHWLYFSDHSWRNLEQAGFDYDSTWGYNDAVGFRSGTLQVFRQPGNDRLLELPLTIMDSAMFYPDRMGLTRDEACERCASIVKDARRFGGALVVNWHDRSLAPERQWGRSYETLLDDIESSGGWFANAGAAVDWFRWRRAIRFVDRGPQEIAVDAPEIPATLPRGRLVVHGRDAAREQPYGGGVCCLTW